MGSNRDMLMNFFSGGCGGTVAAIVTCPLEVVKTRLQSSSSSIMLTPLPPPAARCDNSATCSTLNSRHHGHTTVELRSFSMSKLFRHFQTQQTHTSHASPRLSIIHCFKYIVKVEGVQALWRGLGPNLLGVAPSRAIYFCSYEQLKKVISTSESFKMTDVPLHIVSSMGAGLATSTATNPIWFVKTRLQLDRTRHSKGMTAWQCVKRVYKHEGIRGFYKGVSASYYGVSETVINFVIYEALKKEMWRRGQFCDPEDGSRTWRYFINLMGAAVISKVVASTTCYPHEVARTRLREDGNKYYGFWQTLGLVWKEEGWQGMYRGLATQMVRHIPNTAILMVTYESVMYVLSRNFGKSDDEYEDDDYDD